MPEKHSDETVIRLKIRPVPSPWAADVKPFRPYVYRGQGYDIYEDAAREAMPGEPGFDFSEIPSGCTCTWAWGPPGFRWERIGVKEDCPWHRVADTLGRQP